MRYYYRIATALTVIGMTIWASASVGEPTSCSTFTWTMPWNVALFMLTFVGFGYQCGKEASEVKS